MPTEMDRLPGHEGDGDDQDKLLPSFFSKFVSAAISEISKELDSDSRIKKYSDFVEFLNSDQGLGFIVRYDQVNKKFQFNHTNSEGFEILHFDFSKFMEDKSVSTENEFRDILFQHLKDHTTFLQELLFNNPDELKGYSWEPEVSSNGYDGDTIFSLICTEYGSDKCTYQLCAMVREDFDEYSHDLVTRLPLVDITVDIDNDFDPLDILSDPVVKTITYKGVSFRDKLEDGDISEEDINFFEDVETLILLLLTQLKDEYDGNY